MSENNIWGKNNEYIGQSVMIDTTLQVLKDYQGDADLIGKAKLEYERLRTLNKLNFIEESIEKTSTSM